MDIKLTPRQIVYCGHPATIKYIKADLRARGLSKSQIEYELLLIRYSNAFRESCERENEQRFQQLQEQMK